jgi:hypothetical protein
MGTKWCKFIKEVGKLILNKAKKRRSTLFLRQSFPMEIND